MGVEGATAAAHRRAEDVSAPHRRRGGTLPVEAPTTFVADAVQAHVAPEKAAARRKRGEAGIEVGAGVRRTGGVLRKGHLAAAEAEAARGARVRIDAMTKVRAEDAISAPQTVLRLE